MKLLATVVIFMIVLVMPARAWEQRAMPSACKETDNALSELQHDEFEPYVLSKFNIQAPEKLMVVWINPKRQVIVTLSQSGENNSVTCIVAIGNTDTILLPGTSQKDM